MPSAAAMPIKPLTRRGQTPPCPRSWPARRQAEVRARPCFSGCLGSAGSAKSEERRRAPAAGRCHCCITISAAMRCAQREHACSCGSTDLVHDDLEEVAVVDPPLRLHQRVPGQAVRLVGAHRALPDQAGALWRGEAGRRARRRARLGRRPGVLAHILDRRVGEHACAGSLRTGRPCVFGGLQSNLGLSDSSLSKGAERAP